MSYTTQFTKKYDKKILDETDSIIPSFEIIDEKEENFTKIKPPRPYFIIDKFAVRKVVVDIKETEIIKTSNDLLRMGYVIISQKINPRKTWYKNQRVFFRLCPKESIPKNCTVYNYIPRHLIVRYDYVNGLVRLEDKDRTKVKLSPNIRKGFTTSPRGFGDWYEVKEGY